MVTLMLQLSWERTCIGDPGPHLQPLPSGSAQCRRGWGVAARVLPAVGRLGLGDRAAGSLASLSVGGWSC